jgi:hypothetical protein
MTEHTNSADMAFNPEPGTEREVSPHPFWPINGIGIIPDSLMTNEEMVAYYRRLQTEIADNEAALSNFWLEWLKQSDSMLVSWMDTQRQLGDAWYQAVIGQLWSNQDPTGGSSDDLPESWRGAASNAVRLQNEWFGLWASMLGCQDKPNPMPAPEDLEAGASQGAAAPSPVSAHRKSTHAREIA